MTKDRINIIICKEDIIIIKKALEEYYNKRKNLQTNITPSKTEILLEFFKLIYKDNIK